MNLQPQGKEGLRELKIPTNVKQLKKNKYKTIPPKQRINAVFKKHLLGTCAQKTSKTLEGA